MFTLDELENWNDIDYENQIFEPGELIYAEMMIPGGGERHYFAITPKIFFEARGYQFDQEIQCPALDGTGFEEECEGSFSYEVVDESDPAFDPVRRLASIGIIPSAPFKLFMDRHTGPVR